MTLEELNAGIRAWEELARCALDPFSGPLTDPIAELQRMKNSEAQNPIRHLLVILDCLERGFGWPVVSYIAGRDFVIWQVKPARKGVGKFRLWLDGMRSKVWLAGCDLGATPIEMGRVWDRVVAAAVERFIRWDEKMPECGKEAFDTLFHALFDELGQFKRAMQPLQDLLIMDEALGVNGRPEDANEKKKRPTLDEKALALFFADTSRTKTQIAALLGKKPEDLRPKRCSRLEAAMEADRAIKASLISRGTKDKDGTIESWC